MNRAARTLAALATIAGIAITLHTLGLGDLAPPPLTSVDALTDWYEARNPATVTIALVRLTAELAAWYVLGLTVLHGIAGLLGSQGLTRMVDALTLPGTRNLVRAGLGVGLLAATAATAADDRDVAPGTASMRPVPHHAESGATGTVGSARMVPVETRRDTAGHPTDRRDVVERHAGADADPAPPAMPATWRVDDGESFWTIAEDLVTHRLGRPPTDAEVDAFWRTLVERNLGRLVEPANPDLILPGQVFEVPVLEPAADGQA